MSEATSGTCKGACGCVAGSPPAELGVVAAEARFRSTFRVGDMDCPGEEHLVRMALDGHAQALAFDLMARSVTVWHSLPADDIEARIARLGIGGGAPGQWAGRWPARGPGHRCGRRAPGAELAAGHQRRDVRD